MKKMIVCMGSVNMDLCMYMQAMPAVGETVRTDNFATYPGGKAGNQAAAAGELGGRVCVLARLGDDSFSRQLTEELRRHGVEDRYLIYEPGATAGIAMIRIDAEIPSPLRQEPTRLFLRPMCARMRMPLRRAAFCSLRWNCHWIPYARP